MLTVFGTVDKFQIRTVAKIWVEWARKNGKSELAAAVALLLLYHDQENGAEIYGAASDKEQALIVFSAASAMVQQSSTLMKDTRIFASTKRIVFKDSFYVAIPADVKGSHGYNAHGIIFDEVHTQPNRELYDVLQTSTGTREQPLLMAITTAGTDLTSLAGQEHAYALQVQKGIVTDESLYVDIRNTPEDADWRDESIWYMSNPHLGTRYQINRPTKSPEGRPFRSIEEMRKMAREAEHKPALQTTFRNLYLNQWTQSIAQWLDLADWDMGAEAETMFTEDELADEPCYVGLDLSATRDVTAYCLLFPGDDVVRVLWRYFLPRKWVEDQPHHPLSQWARDGYVTITDGDIVDFDMIQAAIEADADRFVVRELGHDPWQSTMLVGRLSDAGMSTVRVPPGPSTLNAPTKEVERLVAAGKLHHNGDPVARWMADNAVVQIKGDLVRLSKEKATEKIDGMSALVNAVERWMHAEEPTILKASWV